MLGTWTDEPGEVPVSYLPKFSREDMLLVVFPGVLGNTIEKDVYSKVFFTFLFVQPQFFSGTVSIKQVLSFLRSYVYLILIAEATVLFFPHSVDEKFMELHRVVFCHVLCSFRVTRAPRPPATSFLWMRLCGLSAFPKHGFLKVWLRCSQIKLGTEALPS